MATLALATLAAEAHVATQIAAAVVGSYIDQRFVNPMLFKGDEPEPPRINDLGIQSSSPGAPIPIHFGNGLGRYPGIVIWRGNVDYEQKNSSGKGASQTTFIARQDVAILLGFQNAARGISEIKRIWANGTLVYQKDRDLDETSVALANFKPVAGGVGEQNLGHIVTDADMAELYPDSNEVVEVTGASGAGNNGGFHVWDVRKNNAGDWKLSVYTDDGRDFTSGNSGGGVRFQQTLPDWKPGTVQGWTLHGGAQGAPNSTIQGIEGVDEAPRWLGFTYVVLKGLNLTQFGNRMPTFEFETAATSDLQATSDILEELLTIGGLEASEIDVSGVDDAASETFDFYTVRGAQSTASAIEPILLYGRLYAWEQGGKIWIASKDNLPSLEIDAGLLGAHVQGAAVPREVEIDEPDEADVPSRGEIDFQDVAADGLDGHAFYESNVAAARDLDRTLSARLPITMSADQGRAIIKRMVLQAQYDRQECRISLPISVGRITPATMLYFTTESGMKIDLLVTRVNKGRNGIYEITGQHSPSMGRTFTQAAEPS